MCGPTASIHALSQPSLGFADMAVRRRRGVGLAACIAVTSSLAMAAYSVALGPEKQLVLRG